MTDMTDWRARAGTTFDTFKQPVSGSQGVVSTNHPLGSAAGLEMLALGGNAVDAAIASIFALSIVEPMMVGPLGGGYINIALADGTAACIDHYTLAPAAASPDMYQPVSDTWPDYLLTAGRANQVGHLAAGVPGNLKGWDQAHATYGRLDWATVVSPAIRYARHGFRCGHYLARLVADCESDLARFPASAATFLPGGSPVVAGDLIVQADAADSLEHIAAERSDALYYGELGAALVAEMAANGGLVTKADLAAYDTVRSEPVRGTYRGYEIAGPPPGNSGSTLIIEMLNIAEGFDVAKMGFGTVESSHLLLELLKIGFVDRFRYLGDPATVDIPLERITSKSYAEQRRAGIDLERAASPAAEDNIARSAESANTTHVSVVDGDGNMVSMTQTINELFGSKVTVPGTGLLLNDTQALFDPHPGTPNSIAPRKRCVSSMAPMIVSSEGRPWLALGTPGGVRIFPAVFQALINIIDHGMTLQEAVEAPRLWTQGQTIELEAAFGDPLHQGLADLGHSDLVSVANVAGGMNGVIVDPATGAMGGAACWRADGSPAALAGGGADTVARFNPNVSG